MRARVALFREREDANASAARLRRLGFSVVCLPVIEIRTRPVRPQRSRYDAVVATSDKAFHADGPLDTSSPLYVVGARTGRAAEARGWRLASPPARDADELIRTLAGVLKPGAQRALPCRARPQGGHRGCARRKRLTSKSSKPMRRRRARLGARRKRDLSRLASRRCTIRAARPSSRRRWRRQPAWKPVSLSLSMSACRATLQSPCKQSAQAASRLPKRLMKRGFFEGCAKSSAGSLRLGRPVYRAREKTESARRWSTRK